MSRTALCPNIDKHSQTPEGYIHWHEWADEMSKTHKQHKCPACGLKRCCLAAILRE